MIDDETRKELKSIFKSLPKPVKLVFFTKENACPMCREQKELMEEVSSLSDNVTLEVYDFVKNGDHVMQYNIDKISATAVVGKKITGFVFTG